MNNKNDENKIPDFILKYTDKDGMDVKKVKFYPEDIEKMEKMSLKERVIYKGQLKAMGHYTYEKK